MAELIEHDDMGLLKALPGLQRDAALARTGSLFIECGIEGLTLRKGDGLRVDLATGTVHVFRDDDAPALLRGSIPATVKWRAHGVPASDGSRDAG